MTTTAAVGPALDFAVLGNAPVTLRWLENVLAAVPAIRLVDRPPVEAALPGVQVADRNPDRAGPVTGVVRVGLEPSDLEPGWRPRRLVAVLEDPVERLADPNRSGDGGPEAGGYAPAVAKLTRELDPEEILVLSADETREALPRMLVHLGVEAAPDLGPLQQLDPGTPEPVSQGRRTVLFSRVRDDVEDLEQMAGRSFRSWRITDSPPDPAASEPRTAVFYVGRQRDIVPPPGCLVLDDWGVLPVRLGPVLDRAASLTVLDPLSFPFDFLRESDRGIPIAVRLPDGWATDDLDVALGEPLLSELGPFDEISAGDPRMLVALRGRYSWPNTMLVDEQALSSFATRVALHQERPLRAAKASNRVLRQAIGPEVHAGLGAVAPAERLRALVMASRPERWGSLVPAGSEVTGVATDPGRLAAARLAYPQWRFVAALDDHAEAAHVGLAVLALGDQPAQERELRLRALFRAMRVGGRLIVIERFFEGRNGRTIGAPSPTQLLEQINQVTAGHLVLAEVRSLRLSGDDLSSVGLFSLIKVGRPERL